MFLLSFRLVTPLLGYVDIRMMHEEPTTQDSDADANDISLVQQRFDSHSLSYMIHDLK